MEGLTALLSVLGVTGVGFVLWLLAKKFILGDSPVQEWKKRVKAAEDEAAAATKLADEKRKEALDHYEKDSDASVVDRFHDTFGSK